MLISQMIKELVIKSYKNLNKTSLIATYIKGIKNLWSYILILMGYLLKNSKNWIH